MAKVLADLDETDFWNTPKPTDLTSYIDFSYEAFKRLNTRLGRLEKGEGSGSGTRRNVAGDVMVR